MISVFGWNSTFTDSISGMFEGTLSNPTQTNRLDLNLGSDSTEYIPTRLYDQFTMIARPERELTVTVHWQYENGRESSLELGTSIGPDWTRSGRSI